ncbi:MAG: SRPBCC family protein [Polaromonas sp.]
MKKSTPKFIGLAFLLLIVGVLLFAVTRPDTFRVERSIVVNAPPEKIFPLINDFHGWTAWSPYEKIDPAMNRRYTGTASGKGSIYEWAGHGKSGAGRMEIVESQVPAKIAIKLDFSVPFESHNRAEFAMLAQGPATRVTWSMDGPSPYISKLMGVFFNMDRMIGRDFEIGLENLKTIAEK